MYYRKIITIVMLVTLAVHICAAGKKRKSKRGALQLKETNAVQFIRLVVMRLIYGIASRFGFGESISETLNGAFIPPGVEYDDYGDFNVSDGDDDYPL